MSEWQPVETAPKDGTIFLAYSEFKKRLDKNREFLAYYDGTEFRKYPCTRYAYKITRWKPSTEGRK